MKIKIDLVVLGGNYIREYDSKKENWDKVVFGNLYQQIYNGKSMEWKSLTDVIFDDMKNQEWDSTFTPEDIEIIRVFVMD